MSHSHHIRYLPTHLRTQSKHAFVPYNYYTYAPTLHFVPLSWHHFGKKRLGPLDARIRSLRKEQATQNLFQQPSSDLT